MKQVINRVMPPLAAVVLGGIACRWLWLFAATDYRSHLRVVMLSIASAVLIYAAALLFRIRWAVSSSIWIGFLLAAGLLWFRFRKVC